MRRGQKTPTYRTWENMRQRCSNPRHHQFKNYGARGITVCERWDTYQNFLDDMGEKPPGLTIERENNDGNYEPGNCVWATQAAQNRNKRNTKIDAAKEAEILEAMRELRRRRKKINCAKLARQLGLSKSAIWLIRRKL